MIRAAAISLGLVMVGLLGLSQLRENVYLASYALLLAAIAIAPLAAAARRTRWASPLWLVASLLVTFAALDAEVRILFWPRITVDGRDGRFIVFDPLLGYGPRPAVRARVRWRRLGRVIYDARYTIGPDGFRLTRGANAPQADTTVFLGDSYTFGDGLNDWETLPQQYAAATGYRQRVVNAAFSGYGAGQVVRLIHSDRLAKVVGSGERLFIYPALGEHLARIDARSPLHRVGTPHYELAGGDLRFEGPFHPGFGGRLMSLASRSAIVAGIRDLTLAAPNVAGAELFGAMVEDAKREAARCYRANFLVLLWDEPVWQDGGRRRRAVSRAEVVAAMASQMTRRGVNFVRVSELVPDYPAHLASYVLAGSGHPTALLNRRLATALAARLSATTAQGKSIVTVPGPSR